MKTLFDPISIEDHHLLLASHTQPGKAWENAFNPDDDLGKLFFGIAVEFYRFQVLEKKLYNEMDIRQADELLVDWEKSVGLPNSCFNTTSETQLRRQQQVEQVFSSFGGVQLKEDFVRVAAFFGFDIDVRSGTQVGTFPLQFPILFFATTKSAKHTLFIVLLDNPEADAEFPLPFPIPFSTGGRQFLQCIFDFLSPANVQVIIKNEGEI